MKAQEYIFPEIVTAEPGDISEWTPESVRDYAVCNFFNKRALPLLNDERMKTVWQRLPKQSATGENGCVEFFQRMQYVAEGNTPKPRAALDEELEGLCRAAAVLRKELPTESWQVDTLTEQIKCTLRYLERRIQGLEREKSPFIIERSRGEDAVRICARRVADAMSEMFGSPHYQTSATITSVLTGAAVSKKDIENWAKGS